MFDIGEEESPFLKQFYLGLNPTLFCSLYSSDTVTNHTISNRVGLSGQETIPNNTFKMHGCRMQKHVSKDVKRCKTYGLKTLFQTSSWPRTTKHPVDLMRSFGPALNGDFYRFPD